MSVRCTLGGIRDHDSESIMGREGNCMNGRMMRGRGVRIAAAIGISLLMLLVAFHMEGDSVHRMIDVVSEDSLESADVEVEWWFDPVSKAVCWDGRGLGLPWFMIDLDGNHNTWVSSGSGGIPYMVIPHTNVYNTGGGVPGIGGSRASYISETEIIPPVPHWRDYHFIKNVYTEWFHIFFTKLDLPPDWIIGVQRSDGKNIIPLTDPFWYTEDHGNTWHLFDPSVDRKGNRTCREDFPENVAVAHLDIDPDTLNLKSRGRWITAYLSVENASIGDINTSSILLQDSLKPERWDYQDDVLMLKFGREEFMSTVQVGESVQVKITGKWEDGTTFEAHDIIRVINPVKG